MSDEVAKVVAERRMVDDQITYLAAFALIALIVCIILLFVFSNTITGFGPALQTAVTTITARISAIFPGGVQQLRNSVNLITNSVENGYNEVVSAVTSGVIQSINVVLSVGQQVLNAIEIGLRSLLGLLGELGADIFQFFEHVFQPIVTVVQILGELLIDGLIILYAQFSPIITLITELVLAIQEIAMKF